MKANIYLFSGTGNTELVAKEYKQNLLLRGVDTDVIKIEDCQKFEEPDFLGIAFPIHAFSAPENVLNFVKGLPDGKCGAFIIKVGGEGLKFNDASSAKTISLLQKKGYKVIADNLYVMPYNMLYRHSDSMADKMYFTMKRKAERDVENILSGKQNKLHKDTPVSVIFRAVEQPFMHFNGRFFKVDKDKCVNCNICVNNCPQQNITVGEKGITFGKKCIGCVRCSFNCPKDAIKIGFLNMWKVNGKYRFGEEEPETYEVKYLKKSYKKYFDENGKSIRI